MLDVRVLSYIVPLAEQVLDDLTPVIQVKNYADEDATITGLIRIYRRSTDTLEYTSELATTILAHGTQANIAALSAWSPGAPADDDYFILAEILATSYLPGPPLRAFLGAYTFDIKPGPMGPAPAAHHTTHELGGMDPVDVDGMPGVLAEPQTPANHVTTHEDGGADPLNVDGLHGELADPQPPKAHHGTHELGGGDDVDVTGLSGELADGQPALAHDIAGTKHTSAATPGQVLQADANGLPVDATNTDADVAAAVGASHARQHAITDTDDHTSGATPAQLLQADANGLPVDASNTDTEVANVVLQSKPQTLVDQANIDWDLALGGAAQVTLAGNRTLNAPTNMVNGARYRLKVIQDGTGTRLITWNAVYRFPDGVDPCLTAAINCIDILVFDCDGTHMDCVGMVNALA